MINLMSLSAAAAETADTVPVVEGNWGLIGSTVVTGIAIVFLILAILIFFLWAMGKIFTSVENSKKKKAEIKAAEAAASTPAPAAQPDEAEVFEEYEDDDEIIAVISAAIAAYGEAEGKQYRICGVRKREKSQRTGWSAAGIAENMRGF